MTKQFKPHLACDGNFDTMKFPKLAMRKIDGVRMINVGGKALGRSLKPHANVYTTDLYSDEKYAGMDGELALNSDIRSESLCRDTTSAVNRISGEPQLEWCLFDYLHESVMHLGYQDRLKVLDDKFTVGVGDKLYSDWRISTIPYAVVNNKEEAEAFYNESLDLGFEGAIFRDPNGKHKSGRCTDREGAYLRMKPQSDKEAIVLELVEAMENQNEAKINELGHTERSSHKENKVGKGMVGMLVCKDVESGMIIDIGAGKMTHEEREHYWNNPDEIVGKFVKYRSMDVGVKDKPRFARFMSIRAESDIS